MSRYLLKFVLRSLLALSLLAGASAGAAAQTRAWLERNAIRAGETATLNVEISGSVGGAPDYSPLETDFDLVGSSVDTRIEPGAQGMVARSRYTVVLRPRGSGRLTIPSLSVAGTRTTPLELSVEAAPAAAPDQAVGSSDLFIDAAPDDSNPYVQQAVGWVVRLYAANQVLGGKIDQAVPDGASLTKVGDDIQYQRTINGQVYTVVERRFLLVPERSGPLSMPAAVFEGRVGTTLIEQLMGSGGDNRRAVSRARTLQVRPAPADAPQPWLPLRSLSLSYRSTPQQLRVGNSASLVVEASVDGAGLAQMPELQLPPIDGVQVFAEPVQSDENFANGRPRVKLTRKFSLVPSRTGDARLDGLRLAWWDVGSGTARSTQLPALNWKIAAADGSTPAPLPAPAADDGKARSNASPIAAIAQDPAARWWALAALVFAALWLATLVWALHLRAHPVAAGAGGAKSVPVAGEPPAAPPPGRRGGALRQVLDSGDFGDVAAALCALATPPAADVDEVIARLDDPAQREALQAMQRARWAGGDGPAARAQLRSAFAQGPRWRAVATVAASPLPPLYPPG